MTPPTGGRGGTPERVGAVLPRLFARLGLAGRVRETRGLESWRAAVGEAVARRTEPLGVRSGVLWVAVDGSAWMQELSAQRRQILARLAEHAGRGTICDVRFVMRGTSEMRDRARRLGEEGDDGEEAE